MPDYNYLEYGQLIYVNFGEDISSATELTIILEPKLGTVIEETATLGTANIDVNDEIYLANEYIKYTIQENDLEYAGLWRKKGKVKLSTANLIVSDFTTFTVLE